MIRAERFGGFTFYKRFVLNKEINKMLMIDSPAMKLN